jgi:NAD(P)-dependent dehydrogenase (short-subunit alcohol dehydrogenase family)
MRFEGRRVIVTGGSGGIGRAICVGFAAEGARVAVHYGTRPEAAAETIDAMAGGEHVTVQADMGDPDQVKRMIDDAVSRLGGLDVLVNCAGTYRLQRIADTTYDEWRDAWDHTLAVNLLGAANATWCAVRHMTKGGSIVNVSSRGAFRGEPDHPAYGASKGALNSFAGSMAVALAPLGIRVATVAPGFVQTDMAAPYMQGASADQIRSQSPTGRVATPEDVANAVLFLASDDASFATGAILDLNGASYLRS